MGKLSRETPPPREGEPMGAGGGERQKERGKARTHQLIQENLPTAFPHSDLINVNRKSAKVEQAKTNKQTKKLKKIARTNSR